MLRSKIKSFQQQGDPPRAAAVWRLSWAQRNNNTIDMIHFIINVFIIATITNTIIV